MRWSVGQRAVMVVSYGLGLLILWQWLDIQVWDGGAWFGYAPNSGVVFSPDASPSVGWRALGQAGFLLAWAVPSFWLMRDRRTTEAAEPD